MIFSSTCTYALRALVRLAVEPAGTRVPLRALAETEGLPAAYLATVFQALIAAQLVDAVRGRCGGVSLSRPAEEITLYEIREAIDGVADMERCAAGFGGCSPDVPCMLHDSWEPVRRHISSYLRRTTLRAMADALVAKSDGQGTAVSGSV